MRTVGAIVARICLLMAILVLLGTALFLLEEAAFVAAALWLTFRIARRLSRSTARDIANPS